MCYYPVLFDDLQSDDDDDNAACDDGEPIRTRVMGFVCGVGVYVETHQQLKRKRISPNTTSIGLTRFVLLIVFNPIIL